MKVTDERDDEVTLGELHFGDCFSSSSFGGEIFIFLKARSEDGHLQGACLNNGTVQRFTVQDKVKRLNAEVVIKK